MSDINKAELKHLTELSKIEISSEEEEKFLKEFDQILDHFEDLQNLESREDSALKGFRLELREDEPGSGAQDSEALIEQFPEKEGRHLKVPPIFDRE